MKLHNLYGNADEICALKSGRLQRADHVARMRDERMAQKLLLGNPEEKHSRGRPKMRWEVSTT